jgi:hypothetical protein
MRAVNADLPRIEVEPAVHDNVVAGVRGDGRSELDVVIDLSPVPLRRDYPHALVVADLLRRAVDRAVEGYFGAAFMPHDRVVQRCVVH